MTLWHAMQLVLALGAALYAVRGMRRLSLHAACDAPALLDALETAHRAAQPELARAIAAACEPAWVAQVASAALAPGVGPGQARRAAEDRLSELESDALHELSLLASLARLASPLAFLAIVVELARAFGGEHGLLSLQRGLVESIAISHALLSFALGAGTALIAFASGRMLRVALRARTSEARRVFARLMTDFACSTPM